MKHAKGPIKVSRVWKLHKAEADQDIIRLNSNRMGAKGFKRNQLLTIINRDNGKKAYAFACGAGEEYNMYPCTIALNYDARLSLGVDVKNTHNLEIRKAFFWEQETFYLRHQQSMGARRSHMYSVQGWALGLLSVVLAVLAFV